ncbi:hypothetical protein IWQ61_009387 [Dispira simplex]|nr:hypothetical protein IWQ61_009387 [Dispira simplex]
MTQKLRILCLHGYAQNADIFRVKTGATRKNLRAVADLIYANGPHKVEYPEPGDIKERQVVEQARETAERSEKLIKSFVTPAVLRHPGGHFVPSSSAQQKSLVSFVKRFLSLTPAL